MSIDVALFHPYLKSRGGAERLVHHLWAHAWDSNVNVDIYTLFYDPQSTFEFEEDAVHVVAPQRISRWFARRYFLRGAYFAEMARNVRKDLSGYDAVLISVSGVGVQFAAHNYIDGATFAYVHTPLRAAGTPEDMGFVTQGKSLLGRVAHGVAAEIYRWIYARPYWKNIDVAITNSLKTASRLEYLGYVPPDRMAVFHPPVDNWALGTHVWRNSPERNILYFSRFSHSKRQHLVIRAFKLSKLAEHGWNLILAGHPSDPVYTRKVLDEVATLPADVRKHVNVVLDPPDNAVVELHERATFALFAGWNEDFGIAPLDAFAMGIPILLPSSAGVLETIPVGDPLTFVYSDYPTEWAFVISLAAAMRSVAHHLKLIPSDWSDMTVETRRRHVRSPKEFAAAVWDAVRRWIRGEEAEWWI